MRRVRFALGSTRGWTPSSSSALTTKRWCTSSSSSSSNHNGDASADIEHRFHSVMSHLRVPTTAETIRTSQQRPVATMEREEQEEAGDNDSIAAGLGQDTSIADVIEDPTLAMISQRLAELKDKAAEETLGPRLKEDFEPTAVSSEEQYELARGSWMPSYSSEVTLLRCLQRAGLCSRKRAFDLVTEGHVYVNSHVRRNPFERIEVSDRINVKGHSGILRFQAPRLFAYYKGRNVFAGRADKTGAYTLWDWISVVHGHSHLMPMDILPMADAGLLLLTNDGDLASFLAHPSSNIQRTYTMKVSPKIDPLLADQLTCDGVRIGNTLHKNFAFQTSVAMREGERNYVRVTVRGENQHTMRDLMTNLQRKVNRISRVSIGPYTIKGMKPNTIREVTIPPAYLKVVNPVWAPFIERDWPFFRRRRLRALKARARHSFLTPRECEEMEQLRYESLGQLLTEYDERQHQKSEGDNNNNAVIADPSSMDDGDSDTRSRGTTHFPKKPILRASESSRVVTF
eukprot:PhM_4_TR2237/c0_g1_i1/m.70961/K06178/rluB; 23S rRNA pseudouridine2605 synthase